MLSADAAERLIFTLVTPIAETERLDVSQATATSLGRVLAQPVVSPLDFPHWDNSAMDGYAVRSQDIQQVPVSLTVIEEIPAGQPPQKSVGPMQAARILTGSMMPEGADTVVMQERCDVAAFLGNRQKHEGQDRVTVLQTAEPRAFVRQQGSFARVGDLLLQAGRAIAPADIALLAAAQHTQVQVYRRPRIAILSTGSELVEPGQSPSHPLAAGQIVDSNQYALAALVAQTGAIPVPMGIVSDEAAAVKTAITNALAQSDWVISSGGVSVGDYDYVDTVLAELGATLHIRAVAVKPGKPLTVASLPSQTLASQKPNGQNTVPQLYFGLPGNPASAMVSFWRFVAPAIAKLSGLQGPWAPPFVWAKAMGELSADGQREAFLWGQLVIGEAGYEFTPAKGGHNSGNLVNLVQTTGLGRVPQGQTKIAAGALVQVLKVG
jgi:molybdopterin molybdotransferase